MQSFKSRLTRDLIAATIIGTCFVVYDAIRHGKQVLIFAPVFVVCLLAATVM